jgi:hypothetical protein
MWLFAAALIGLSGHGLVSGQDDKAKKADAKAHDSEESENAFNTLRGAYTMAALGQKERKPELLLAAARIIGTLPRPMEVAEGKLAKEPEDVPDHKKEALELLDKAKRMRTPYQDAIEKVADSIREELTSKAGGRGAFMGPQTRIGTLSGGDRLDTFPIRFRSGEKAMILVANIRKIGDIDLVLADDNGRVLARDKRTARDAYVEYNVPRGPINPILYIKVQLKAGTGRIDYRVTTN